MKLYLIVAKGKHQGMPIPIKIDLFLIGSAKMCQLRSGLQGVGAKHCALVVRDRKVFVRDMDCGFPTLVNGGLVPPGEERPLHAGDRLEVGPLEFMLQFREKPLSQRDLEEWALKCLDHESDRGNREPEDDPFYQQTQAAVNAADAAASILDALQRRRGVVMGRLRIGQEAGIINVRFNDQQLVEPSELALVKRELQEVLNRANLRVLLDCKNVRRMSSMGAEMILDLYHWLRPFGSTLAMCRIRPEIVEVLQALHVLGKVPHYADKKDALTARW
jgi:anti-anti-sigma regulatory factor